MRVLKKVVLMYNWNKEYYLENWSKRKTSTQKTDCPFDTMVILEVDR